MRCSGRPVGVVGRARGRASRPLAQAASAGTCAAAVGVAGAHLADDRPGRLRSGRRRCGSDLARARCTSAVAAPRARAAVGEVARRGDGASATRQASSTPGQELLGEGQVPVRPCRRAGGVGPRRRTRGRRRWARASSRLDQGALHDDVGVLAGLQGAENLDDQRLRRAVGGRASKMIEVLDCSPDSTWRRGRPVSGGTRPVRGPGARRSARGALRPTRRPRLGDQPQQELAA